VNQQESGGEAGTGWHNAGCECTASEIVSSFTKVRKPPPLSCLPLMKSAGAGLKQRRDGMEEQNITKQ